MLYCFSTGLGCLYHFSTSKEMFEQRKLHQPQELYRFARIEFLFPKNICEIAVFDDKARRQLHFFANKDFKEEEVINLITKSKFIGEKHAQSNTNSSISSNQLHYRGAEKES